MSRAPAVEIPTYTVSVSVSPQEGAVVAAAAGLANLTKSAWLKNRTAVSLQSGQRRNGVLAEAQKIEAEPVARGTRSARVSTVLRIPEHEELKKAAAQIGLTVHSYLQAVAISCAGAEMAGLPPPVVPVRAEPAPARTAMAGHFPVRVPIEFARIDRAELGDMLSRLVAATCVKIREGGAAPLIAGAPKLAAQVKAAASVELPIPVSDFEIRAAAHVLGIPAEDYASALGTRAARAMKAH